MARETSYFVQAFDAGRGGNLKAGTPIACKTATGALRTAERLALSKLDRKSTRLNSSHTIQSRMPSSA